MLVLVSLIYTVRLLLLSRTSRTRPVTYFPDDLLYVFLVPCLNEEKVIGTCIERLLALPYGNFVVMVIDDGSDDATPDIVCRYNPEKVWLLQRALPQARQGKGEALNAATAICARPRCWPARTTGTSSWSSVTPTVG